MLVWSGTPNTSVKRAVGLRPQQTDTMKRIIRNLWFDGHAEEAANLLLLQWPVGLMMLAVESGYLQALMRARPLSASFALQRCVGDSVMMISSVGLTWPSCR